MERPWKLATEARPGEAPATRERFGFSPIRGESLAEEAANQIYAGIIHGRIRLGERLSEAAIARELGISRGPVRDAQRLLERRGLLVFKPRRGFFVREMSPAQIEGLFGLRRVLERFAIEETIARADDQSLQQLAMWRERLLGMDRETDGEPVPASALVEEDIALHRLICALSGNSSLQAVFEYTLTELRLALSLINLGFRGPKRIVESHSRLLDALLARDTAAAVSEMERHLEYSRARMMEQLGNTETKDRRS